MPHYNAVDNCDMMEMSYKLSYKKLNGKTKNVIQRKPIKHWWLNGFKIGHAMSINRLKMDALINFPNSGMAKAFKKNLSKKASTNMLSSKKVRIQW